MKKLHLLFILIVSLVTSFSLTSCDKGDDAEGSIYGIVTTSGEPLKGIGVSLYKGEVIDKGYDYKPLQYNYNLLLKTVTYDDGSYEFTNLKPGTYKLMVEDEKYATFTTNVEVEAGRQARADMKLSLVDTHMNVSTISAELSGNSVTMVGKYRYQSYSPHEYGFFYGTSPNPSQTGNQVTGKGTSTDYLNYQFEAKVTKLSAGTYYYQAYAKNKYGTTYGDVLTFSFSGEPVVKTLAASEVTETSAILNGEVTYEGSPAYTERGFIYSVNYVTPTITEGTVIKISGTGEGTYSYKLTGLTKDETYYVRAYVKSGNNVSYGDVISFLTNEATFIDKGDYVILKNEGIMVQKKDLGVAYWDAANELCKDSRVGGYSDWRLPTIGELGTLYNNRTLIGGFNSGSGSGDYYPYCYWSSTYYGYSYYDGDMYYYMILGSGYTDYVGSDLQLSVRAVRTIQ